VRERLKIHVAQDRRIADVRFGSKAVIPSRSLNVLFAPEADIK
jgi:hypothetical protein